MGFHCLRIKLNFKFKTKCYRLAQPVQMRENLLLLNMNAIRSRNIHDFFNDLLLWHNSISLSYHCNPKSWYRNLWTNNCTSPSNHHNNSFLWRWDDTTQWYVINNQNILIDQVNEMKCASLDQSCRMKKKFFPFQFHSLISFISFEDGNY